MPYDRISELPAQVKKLPKKAQQVFRRAFNSAKQRGVSEARAFQIAYAAVRNAGYETSSDRHHCGACDRIFFSESALVLHRDRLGHEEG